MHRLRVGIDVGSTTTKAVALDEQDRVVFSRYVRHMARAKESVIETLAELKAHLATLPIYKDVTPDACRVSLRVTGSIGMGIAERVGLPFVQEVVAASKCIQHDYPEVQSMIDIGGEDAKVVFFRNGEAQDLRMNGNCAGGTGAFIDQMAVILGVTVDDLNALAMQSTQVYPIASRCGVFSKTDIQNLIAKNIPKTDIAASIFRAVAVQTVMTLAHGCEIRRPVLFCGGPLNFIPALRKAFIDYMHLSEQDIVQPERGTLLPAEGAALAQVSDLRWEQIDQCADRIRVAYSVEGITSAGALAPIFSDEAEYRRWSERILRNRIPAVTLAQCAHDGVVRAYMGIDSGSTTTKIVLLDAQGRMLYDYYHTSDGNPIGAVEQGLAQLQERVHAEGLTLQVVGSCSTGYGEDLMRAAFQLDHGIIETIAHFLAAQHIDPEVSFILDIGGQDMKAVFVQQGIINRMEINEACSSGCGSFLSTFATSLGYDIADFARQARQSQAPCDLGTRCTVFMNSKVKQVLREGASVADLSAGLAYSVIRNCLYKVLKLKSVDDLGKHIVVQGGTMRNDAVVRALEILTGAEVSRCDKPELMGAYGCALYAIQQAAQRGVEGQQGRGLEEMLGKASYTTKNVYCHGCDNQCLVTTYRFGNGKTYFSGNRCEKVFVNGAAAKHKGLNAYQMKLKALFERQSSAQPDPSRPMIGVLRGLNQYEEFPFWHTFFTECGVQVVLSAPSNYTRYEQKAGMVMSDNICFPAKLMHSHVQDLVDRGVRRIFMPFVIHERDAGGQNSYNCPVVTGYSEVIRSVQGADIEMVSPAISFRDDKLLLRQCRELMAQFGVRDSKRVKKAFAQARYEQQQFEHSLRLYAEDILAEARNNHRMVILLAGRPYHTDPLIQHQVADMIAGMGVDVITDDIVRGMDIDLTDVHFVPQWAYPNRILKAAKWCAMQGDDVHMVQFTSFGCGPDAFLVDEVRDLMMRHHKSLTLLKLDDINNVGSMKLRIRSLIESLRLAQERHAERRTQAPDRFQTTPTFDETCRGRKILVPFFTQFVSPFIPVVFRLAGYDCESLPLSDSLSGDMGLQYANNEVCYPATLIVGDFVKAFRTGQYDPEKTAVAITQTGGQCRASNYITLIKKALVDAGYPQVPVISVAFEDMGNDQPGFSFPVRKILPVVFYGIMYGDVLAKFYYPAAVREREPGQARALRDKYLQLGVEAALRKDRKGMMALLSQAAEEFNAICVDRECSKVGIVGEIFLKFHPYAHKHVVDWLIERGIEVQPPVLIDFFMQSFVNRRVNLDTHITRSKVPDFIFAALYKVIRRQYDKFNRIGAQFRYYQPLRDIFEEAEAGRDILTLNAQFGEGWLLPAEVAEFARMGVNHVISLQPFGCIANHIIARGVEHRIKEVYPDMNLLSIDFDAGVSEVNITNRLLLFIEGLK
ncbi:MAG: acyl-CoA dehydratase activase-related protein [Bacteroidales bacterium]|nr:acyl-CoA dehydratase activase-related protein [Bacteroidales bacterium]